MSAGVAQVPHFTREKTVSTRSAGALVDPPWAPCGSAAARRQPCRRRRRRPARLAAVARPCATARGKARKRILPKGRCGDHPRQWRSGGCGGRGAPSFPRAVLRARGACTKETDPSVAHCHRGALGSIVFTDSATHWQPRSACPGQRRADPTRGVPLPNKTDSAGTSYLISRFALLRRYGAVFLPLSAAAPLCHSRNLAAAVSSPTRRLVNRLTHLRQ